MVSKVLVKTVNSRSEARNRRNKISGSPIPLPNQSKSIDGQCPTCNARAVSPARYRSVPLNAVTSFGSIAYCFLLFIQDINEQYDFSRQNLYLLPFAAALVFAARKRRSPMPSNLIPWGEVLSSLF